MLPGRERLLLGRVFGALAAAVWALGGGHAGAQTTWVDQGARFRRWTVEQGLPQVTVPAIAQTPDGFLWVATFGGLSRFDGVSFTTFDFLNSAMPSNRVTALFVDHSGTLWIGTEEGWLVRYDGRAFQTLAQLDETVQNHMFETGDGVLHVSSFVTWYRVEGDGRVVPAEAGMDPRGGAGDPAGRAWVEGESVFVRDRLGEVLPVRGDRAWGGPRSVSTNADGMLAVASGAGVFLGRWDRGAVEARCVDERPAGLVLLSDRKLYASRPGSVSELAIADAHGAAPARAWTDHTLSAGVECRMIDAEGTVWLGTTDGGLVSMRDAGFQLYATPGRPSGFSAVSIYPGRMLLGFESGLFTAEEGRPDSLTEFVLEGADEPDDELPRVLMRSRRSEEIWIGAGARIVRLSRDLAVLSEYTLGTHGVFAISEDDDGTIWAGGGDGLGRLDRAGGVFVLVPESGELSRGGPVRAVCRGPGGDLLVGSSGGLYSLGPGGMSRLSCGDGKPLLNVRALFPDGDGAVWVGTYGCGLLRLRGGELRRLTEEDGLLNNCVSSLQVDGQDRLWMNTNRGAFCAARASLDRAIDGAGGLERVVELKSGECNHQGGWMSEAGVIWFPTVDGVVAIDTNRVARGAAKPGVEVESVSSDGARVDDGGEIRLAPRHRNLTFRYAGLTYVDPEAVRFRCRLDGYDAGWVDAGHARTATYRHLPPGRYTFRVQASSSSGVWSDRTATVGVVLRPHVYETRWFLIVCVASVAGLAYGAHAHRLGVMRRHNRELRREIDERERVEREKESVERDLRRAQRLESIGTLASGITHDFNNLLFAIETGASHLRRSAGLDGDAERALSVIGRSVEQARSIIQSLRTFSERHEVEWEPVDLRACVESLRPTLESLLAPTHRLALEVEHGAALTTVGSAAQIQQVVMNLVVNARDAMARGGVVRVNVGVDPEDAGSINLRVIDTGSGIDEAVKARIFDPFFTTKPLGNGTGLGLAIVYGVVKDHAGHIRVDSVPGVGTAIIVTLQRAAV